MIGSKNYNIMIQISTSKHWCIGKWGVLGNCLSNPQRQIQEKLETIYAIGCIRVTIKHKWKFVERIVEQSTATSIAQNVA